MNDELKKAQLSFLQRYQGLPTSVRNRGADTPNEGGGAAEGTGPKRAIFITSRAAKKRARANFKNNLVPINGAGAAVAKKEEEPEVESLRIRHSTLRTAANQKTTSSMLFDVITFLKDADRAVTEEEIAANTGLQISAYPDLLNSLKNNPKVGVVDKWFSYKPTYDVTNKEELLDLIMKTPDGIDSAELKDSYKNVVKDTKELQEEGKILVVYNSEAKTNILYPNEPHLRFEVFPEFKEMWKEVKVPDQVDLERSLNEAGLKLLPEDDELKSEKYKQPKEKKKRKKRKVKITNTHVVEIDLSRDFTPSELASGAADLRHQNGAEKTEPRT
ncbi:transcription factor TFIIE beta subunit, TFIIEB, Tfa2 [Balamuthia mandrillaris]